MGVLLQGIPDPSTFAAADSWGVPAALLFMVACMGYLLYRSEKRCEAAKVECQEIQEKFDGILEKYENVLLEDLRHYKERDRTFDLLTRSRGGESV